MSISTSMHQRFRAVQEDNTPRPAPPSPSSFESQLLALLRAPLRPGETAAIGNQRKEGELRVLLATLEPLDAWNLHRRITIATPDDQIVAAFARLVPERRARLLAFLGDSKRRAAVLARR